MSPLDWRKRLFILGFASFLLSVCWAAGIWGVHKAEAAGQRMEQAQAKRVFGPEAP